MEETISAVEPNLRPTRATVDVASVVASGGSVISRIEMCLLAHVGEIVTRKDLEAVADGAENWHQRLSELRTDHGYTIQTNRDRPGVLFPGEYVLVSADKRAVVAKRVMPTAVTWSKVLERSSNACEWSEDGSACLLPDGAIDPVGGGTVRLTPDHLTPHSVHAEADRSNPDEWGALCGRHQVMKKNYWDSRTGKFNLMAVVQAASKKEKELVYAMLREMFEGPQKV